MFRGGWAQLLCRSYFEYYARFRKFPVDFRLTPIIINNFNRLDSLINLVNFLQKSGYRKIVVIDNGSTYKPLLEYYETASFQVVREVNLGPYALWKIPKLWDEIKYDFYAYTDSDIVPCDDCPDDFIGKIIGFHYKYRHLGKIGLSLKIDDIPSHYSKRDAVLALEKNYWLHEISDGLYDAAVDTTFAVYKPLANGGWWTKAARVASPIQARHLPWYENEVSLSDEEMYYRKSAKKGFSSWTDGEGLIK